MRKFNNLRQMLRTAALLAIVGLATFTSCTKVDDTLGSNLVPDNQQMKAGYVSMPAIDELNPKKYVETRLFQTDSIIGSNISYGYMGAMLSDTFGLRTAGFLSQYTSYYLVKSDYFGYKPFMDSVQILLSMQSYGKDTLSDQTFGVYEITSNSYLTDKPISPGKSVRDTTFYLSFNPTAAGIVGDQLFTFSIGETFKNGPATKAITMTPTEAGKTFIKKLMLQEGTYKDKYSIYSTDSLKYWVEEFKGLYIKPEGTPGMKKGTIYSTSLDASGFVVYGRNRVKDDPTLIKDTIGMVYYFYDSFQTTYGNVSINSILNDYTLAATPIPGIEQANETNTTRPETSTVYVAGMGGVVSELTFTQEFFDDLEAQIEKENTASKKDFKTLAFSQVRMSIYLEGSDYDWRKIVPGSTLLINWMNASQKRLGLYTNYKKLTPITDYAYVYENTYSAELAYGGYINRSQACYVMDITGYMQGLWNNYVKIKSETPAGQAVDLTKLDNRTVYLAPEAYDLFTPQYSVAQGMAGTINGKTNNAPIRFDLTYNMIK